MTEKIAEGFKGGKAILIPYNTKTYLSSNEITRKLFVTHIGYYPKARFHYRTRESGARQNILILCEEGRGWIIYKNEKHSIERNQAFIIPAEATHTYGTDNSDPWSIYWFHFSGENVDDFSSIIGKVIHVDDSDSSRYRDRILLFEEIFQNLEMGYSHENLEYTTYCLMHFLASLKYLTQFREVKRVKEIDGIQRSIIYMKEHLEENITLQDIAEHVGYSPSHFGNLFRERTSFSPIEYYNQLRIQRACSYLQFSDLKIKEIAYRLCFYDPFHFSKAFKKEMEITPNEYRKRYNRLIK